MHSNTQFKSWLPGLVLGLLLACFSANSLAMYSAPLYSGHFDTSITAGQHDSDDLPSNGTSKKRQHPPAKSLTPSLASLWRNGSLLPERFHDNEPEYQLVIELPVPPSPSFGYGFAISISPWRDWVRHSPPSSSRVSGWKESNSIYRSLSQNHIPV